MDDFYYGVEYNNKIIGIYNDFLKAKIFILSCLQNNLMISNGNPSIITFSLNSCYQVNKNNIILEDKISEISLNKSSKPVGLEHTLREKNNISKNKVKVKEDNPVLLEMAKQKIELQHKINMLKHQKNKIEESKKVYENDIKLFDMFLDNQKKDPNFKIPELFEKKFELILKLKNENNLNWESFVSEYYNENDYNEYFALNDYEEHFITNNTNDSNISEELDIETDSITSESSIE
jgi:hypothetical protein